MLTCQIARPVSTGMVSTLTDTKTYFLRGSWQEVFPPSGTLLSSIGGTGELFLDSTGGVGDFGVEQWSRANLTMETVWPSMLSVRILGYFSKLISLRQLSRWP